ncbi:hypothetical protein [Vibrio paucivorans]|uniref:Uncharacterized protein n=1 Tax=Vibrio paucivorans TaxID=2829489 RepID=A0A9X3HT89_9VIBR|nr:hypothetical protein [Vibrio paucivorans]MCW8335443.1 hypothetical protein [Vibrio paucivorans]
MKKNQFVLALIAAGSLVSGYAAAEGATGVLSWSGIVPGAIVGSDIGLANPNGGEIEKGSLAVEEDGTFVSDTIAVRAFSLTEEQEIDPQTPYAESVNWSVDTVAITHEGVNGNAGYNNEETRVTMNGAEANLGEVITTEAGSPDMLVSVSYDNAPEGEVTGNDRIHVVATLYAEGNGGIPL